MSFAGVGSSSIARSWSASLSASRSPSAGGVLPGSQIGSPEGESGCTSVTADLRARKESQLNIHLHQQASTLRKSIPENLREQGWGEFDAGSERGDMVI